MHSNYFKNIITTASLVIFSFLLIGISFALSSRSVFIAETQQSVVSTASEVSKTAEPYAESGNLTSLDLRMTLTSIAAGSREHLMIISRSGFVINCSDSTPLCDHIGIRISDTAMQLLEDSHHPVLYGTLDGFYSVRSYIVSLPLVDKAGSIQGYLVASKDSSSALSIWLTILPLFFFISVLVLLLALLLSYFSARYLYRPLRNMNHVVRQFGRGDLSARMNEADRTDEIGELAQAFNSMADSLEQSEVQRREFVANVSHELKTPMTTISGFADGILDGTIPASSQRHYLQIISSETKRLSRLVRSMLELSRLQAEDRSALLQNSFNITEILRLTLVNFIDKIDQQQLDVDFKAPEADIFVRGDADAITQVVYNLLDNAIKFSHSQSTLVISLWKDSEKAYISIQNNGNTIPDAEIPLLFDRFHKADRSRSKNKDGVGLGLHIVKTILDNHGEGIAVTSHEGKTNFVFTLALKQQTGVKNDRATV